MHGVEPARAPVATLTSLLGVVARAELSTGASAEHTAKLGTELLRTFEAGVVWTAGWAISTPRALATVATSLGQPEEAHRWLTIAGSLAERSGAVTEQVQVWIREAELDRTTDGAAGAMRASRNCLRAMRTADSIGARALSAMAAHALDVGGEVEVDQAPLFERTILFTDVVGSTPLNVEVGDHRFVAMLDEHNEVLRRVAEERGGVVFHNTGDGYGVWFTNAADAWRAPARCTVGWRSWGAARFRSVCASASPPADRSASTVTCSASTWCARHASAVSSAPARRRSTPPAWLVPADRSGGRSGSFAQGDSGAGGGLRARAS